MFHNIRFDRQTATTEMHNRIYPDRDIKNWRRHCLARP